GALPVRLQRDRIRIRPDPGGALHGLCLQGRESSRALDRDDRSHTGSAGHVRNLAGHEAIRPQCRGGEGLALNQQVTKCTESSIRKKYMKDVKDKVAFITGGASGIGLAMARVFVREGMKVVIADIRRDHLDEAMASLDGRDAVHAVELDVS